MLSRIIAVLTLAALAVPLVTSAQDYPNRPVRLMAFAPGTTSDIIGRMFADKLTQQMGQPFVVKNRTGAGGTIAADQVTKSVPDGYTLLMSTAALPVSAHVYPGLKYDTAKDFASVTVITHSPLLLAANLNFPPKNVQELIQYAKANPGKVNFGSAGVGTSHQRIGNSFAPMPREASGSGTGRVGEAVRVGHDGLGLPLRDRQASGLMANTPAATAAWAAPAFPVPQE